MKYKRYMHVFAVVIIIALLTGCTDALFTTAKYQSYQSFADRHRAGMEKQAVLDKLGCPDGYLDIQGSWHDIPQAEKESFEENHAENGSTAWIYECYKWPDPAGPYRLKITFDDEGKSTSVEMMLVPGG